MVRTGRRRGFTIIELLIVVIVIGILAAAGLAKYQNFAESSRRKTCMSQITTIENAMAAWETVNQAFAENAKTAWGFSPRTGQLFSPFGGGLIGAWGANLGGPIFGGTAGVLGAIPDAATQPTVGGPPGFYNQGAQATPNAGPLSSIIRDDKVWVCPSALSRYYGGEVQNVPDDYMDVRGEGVSPTHSGVNSIGMSGRYGAAVAGTGNKNTGSNPITNGGFTAGFVTGVATASSVNSASPCPQTPFKIVFCGCYGSFGPGSAATTPGTAAFQNGGPVGPDGSILNRHSARW